MYGMSGPFFLADVNPFGLSSTTTRSGSPPPDIVPVGPRRERATSRRLWQTREVENKPGSALAILVAAIAVLLGGPRLAEQPAEPATKKEAAPTPRGPGPSAEGPSAGTSGRRVLEPLRLDREVYRRDADVAQGDRAARHGSVRHRVPGRHRPRPDRLAVRPPLRQHDRRDPTGGRVAGLLARPLLPPWRPEGDQPAPGEILKPLRDPAAPPREVPGLTAIFGSVPAPGLGAILKPGREPGPARPRHEIEPGLLLFRAGLKDRYYAVFLVGESPVSGIHKDAMVLALDIIRQQSRKAGPRPQPIRVVGPYFSSGAASLARAISAWAGPPDPTPPEGFPEVEVRCGSAISVDRGEFIAACKPAAVGFQATVLPYPVVMSGLLDYLKKLNGNALLEKVAILHESSTTFGQSVRRNDVNDYNFDFFQI